jgi:RHS repeat-associated protein
MSLVNKLVRPTTEFLDHLARRIPEALAKGHHRVAQHVHDAADRFDKVEDDLAGRAGQHHGHDQPGHEPHTGPVDGRPGSPAAADGGPGRGGLGPDDPAKAGRPGHEKKCDRDPIDVATGELLLPQVDVQLAGGLPLVVERTHISSYRHGLWFGPTWASTLDQRLQLDAHGVVFASADGMLLVYPVPQANGEVLPVNGPRRPLSWSGEPNTPMRITDPNTGETLVFDDARPAPGVAGGVILRITAVEDRNGRRIDISYTDDAPALITHHGGYRIAIDRHPDLPRVIAFRLLDTNGPGTETTLRRFGYDDAGNLIEVYNSSGLPLRFTYDSRSRITGWTDRSGNHYAYVYDDAGRVVEVSGTNGFLSGTLAYDDATYTTSVTDSLGHTTTYQRNEAYLVIRRTDPLGHTILIGYDELGRVVSLTDEIGRTTRFGLDEHGDPVRINEPDGNVIELGYNELRLLASFKRNGTVFAEFTYDLRGNLLRTTDAAGAETVRQYDEPGRLVSVTDPLGHTRRIETNPAGLITAVTDALGHTARATYDAFGHLAATIDPLGATTRFVRRTEGEITERVHPDGTSETWSYDPDGNLIEQRDQIGAVTRFEIGAFGLLTRRVLPDGEDQRFVYDTEQNLLSVTMNNATWQYRYDAAGRLVGETDFNGRSLTYRLDDAGQLLETDSGGRSTGYAYNLQGELVERRNHDGSATTLGYDDEQGFLTRVASRASVLEYTYDRIGRVLSETVDGRTTSYTYDLLGRRVSRTTPTGLVSTWTYDANNQSVGLSGPLGELAFEYDAGGRETSRRVGADVTLTQSWDACNRLTGQTVRARGEGVQKRTYGYRADGMPNLVTDRLRGRREFELTASGRITRVTAETWSESYAYDPLGNITRARDTRAPDSTTAGDRAYAGSLLRTAGRTAYEYDDQGRLVRRLVRTLSGQRREWRYTWDAEDQLVRADTPDHGSWAYAYDPFGRRTAKWRLGEQDGLDVQETEKVVFAWEGTQLLEQHETSPDGSRRTVTWDWEPGTWRPVSQAERSWDQNRPDVEERFCAIVTDLVDAPSELVTDDGRVVWSADTDLWGRRRRTGADDERSCPLGRPGQYHDDESGLEYNYFRYYDPATGRYLSSDPLGLDAGPNPHAYVPNPLVWIDPLGLARKRQPVGWGGWYGKLQPANWDVPHPLAANNYEINHIPAKDTYLKLGLATDLKEPTGPAIRMDYDDHRKLISTGSGAASDAWRRKQEALIRQGKFDVAMKMDIGVIRKRHGTKYDAAIKEMVDSLPHNKKFQQYLTDNGWEIRYCLLQ